MVAGAALLGSALIGALSSQKSNDAALQANQQNINARERERSQLIGRDTPFEQTSLGPNGISQRFTGTAAGDSVQSRDTLAKGDIGRAGNINSATNDFKLNIPNLGAARGIVEEENNLRQAPIDQTINSRIAQNQRTLGRDNNTGANGALIDALARFDAGRGGQREAVSLFQQSGANDRANQAAAIANNQAQGPVAPGFTPPNSNVLAQVPGREQIKDNSSFLPLAAGGTLLKDIIARQDQQRQEARFDEQNNKLLAALAARGTGNQFNTPQAASAIDTNKTFQLG